MNRRRGRLSAQAHAARIPIKQARVHLAINGRLADFYHRAGKREDPRDKRRICLGWDSGIESRAILVIRTCVENSG